MRKALQHEVMKRNKLIDKDIRGQAFYGIMEEYKLEIDGLLT
jgi:hypothetical protein